MVWKKDTHINYQEVNSKGLHLQELLLWIRKLLLLDEPFSALDEHLRNNMMLQLKEDLIDFKRTSIFVTHNMEEAYQLCNNIIIIAEGSIDAIGHKDVIFNNPPTLYAAKLTGCKNISKAKKIGNNISGITVISY